MEITQPGAIELQAETPQPSTAIVQHQPIDEVWGAVEIFGHRSHVGRISEVEKFGTKMLQVEIPTEDGRFEVLVYGGAAVFGMRVISEAQGRAHYAQKWKRQQDERRAEEEWSARHPAAARDIEPNRSDLFGHDESEEIPAEC